MERTLDVLALVLCAAVVALVSAAFGPTSLRLGDVVPADELGRVFRTWSLSDFCGVLVVAPVVLTWASYGVRGIRRRDLIEGAIGLLVLGVLAEVAPQRDVPYIVFPVLLWAALRLGPRGAATAIVVVCSITVWNTAQEDGPFVRDSITDSLLATQLFIATAALTSLLLAAVTAERTRAARALAASEATQRELADEHAALRRVATLVAAEAPPGEVFQQVTEEVGWLLGLPAAAVVQYDGANQATVVATWSEDGRPAPPVGTPLGLDGDSVVAKVLRTGDAHRIDRYDDATGSTPERLRGMGYRGAVAAPVTVAGGIWGALVAATASPEPLPERRRAAAVRLRRPRRPGPRQRRRARAPGGLTGRAGGGERLRAAPPGAQPSRRRAAAARLRGAQAGHGGREARRGPGQRARALCRPLRTTSRAGSRSCASWRAACTRSCSATAASAPALDALLTRAPVPVEIVELPERRLTGPVEAAAYYLVAEAITNVAKYAEASRATVSIRQVNGNATVTVADDGVGGANPAARLGPARAGRPRRGAQRPARDRQPAGRGHPGHGRDPASSGTAAGAARSGPPRCSTAPSPLRRSPGSAARRRRAAARRRCSRTPRPGSA